MKTIIAVLIILSGSMAFANEQNLYPPNFYPQPEPRHYSDTGAVCWQTQAGAWKCESGKPADKTEINIGTGGGFIPYFNNHLYKNKRNPKKSKSKLHVKFK